MYRGYLVPTFIIIHINIKFFGILTFTPPIFRSMPINSSLSIKLDLLIVPPASIYKQRKTNSGLFTRQVLPVRLLTPRYRAIDSVAFSWGILVRTPVNRLNFKNKLPQSARICLKFKTNAATHIRYLSSLIQTIIIITNKHYEFRWHSRRYGIGMYLVLVCRVPQLQ